MPIIAKYSLNGNANDSVGALNGTPTNVTWVDGKQNQAGSFNGSNSQISTANSSIFNFGVNDFSISAILKPNSSSFFDSAVSSTFANKGHRRIYTRYFGNQSVGFGCRPTNGSDFDLNTGINISNGSMNHVVVTRVSGVFNIYINGLLVLTDSTKTTLLVGNTGGGIMLGYNVPDNGRYTGVIDEVEIYSHALTPAEVKNLFLYYNGFM